MTWNMCVYYQKIHNPIDYQYKKEEFKGIILEMC